MKLFENKCLKVAFFSSPGFTHQKILFGYSKKSCLKCCNVVYIKTHKLKNFNF